MLYYVYCEWLDEPRLKRDLPDVEFLKKVTLPGFRLAFSAFTEDGSDEVLEGGCNLLEAPDQESLGVLYDFSDADLVIAEKLMRVEQGRYVQRTFNVVDEDGERYEALAYVIKHFRGPSKPSREYLDHMIKGAKDYDLPETFIENLKSLLP